MWNRIIKTSAALYIPLLIFTLVWGYLQKKELITNMGQIQQRNILSKSYNLIDQGMVLIDITSFWSSVTFPASFSDKNQLNPDFLNTVNRLTNVVKELNNYQKKLIDKIFEKIRIKENSNKISFKRIEFKKALINS